MNLQVKSSRPFWHHVLIWAFSLLLSATVIQGYHFQIVSPYDGLYTENYLIPWSGRDCILFTALAVSVLAVFYFLLNHFRKRESILTYPGDTAGQGWRKEFFCIFAVLFLAWIPWLLCYSPGFVFPDTDNALQQALGILPLNNRNPILFTMFLRLCLFLGGARRSMDITAGCWICCIIQMLYMAACFAYMICWVCSRGKLPKSVLFVLTIIYAFCPYVAADSIAMWKDPIFSTSIVVWSLLLCDLALSKGRVQNNRRWCFFFVLLALIISFWRNNGISVVFCAFLLLLVLRILKPKGVVLRRPTITTGFVCLLWIVIVIPVYSAFGIGTPKEESAGLMLNQMARVVVYDGEMAEEEKEFLDEIMPLEHYKDAYRPCCVDLMKWDDQFNYNALSGSKFIKTWAALFMKNPRLYFDAWQLETYGFWTVNRPEINLNTKNISAGAPYNTKKDVLLLGDYSLRFQNLLGTDGVRKMLPVDSWSFPLGILNWLIIFIALLLLLNGNAFLLMSLAPSIGIMTGLLLGTPISYLARYEASAQFLLPLFLLLLFRKRKCDS